MEEQDIMNAYYCRTAVEVFRLEQWYKAIPSDVAIDTEGISHVNLIILKENGFPSRQTEVIARDELATRLRCIA
jgi:hypothetical protein